MIFLRSQLLAQNHVLTCNDVNIIVVVMKIKLYVEPRERVLASIVSRQPFVYKQYLQDNEICINNPRVRGEHQNPQILVGLDHYYDLVNTVDTITLPSGLRIARTVFGPTIHGKGSINSQQEVTTITHGLSLVQEQNESEILQKLFELDGLGISSEECTKNENTFEYFKSYSKTMSFENGVVTVPFPLKDNVIDLTDNYGIAYRRLISLQRQLSNNIHQREWYNKIMNDYIQNGVVELVHGQNKNSAGTYYMPHSGVWKPEKAKPLRIVFDASSKRVGQLSLNDVIYTGESFVKKIHDVLVASRTSGIILLCDIEAAFTQIRLVEDHKDFCRFLWLKDMNKPPNRDNIAEYRFNRLPFGNTSAPSILNMVILAYLNHKNTPLSLKIAKNVYVDNILLCANTKEEALEKYTASKNIFREIGMNLREYISNSAEVNRAIPKEDRAPTDNIKLLGVKYDTKSDEFVRKVTIPQREKLTKRDIVSQINSIYDPVGLASPLIIKLKSLMREIYDTGIEWKQYVPQALCIKWNSVIQGINNACIRVSRPLLRSLTSHTSRISLWVFCDASKMAISTCAYLRCENTNEISSLISGKSKLTPKKIQQTIPRLGLLAILIGLRMAKTILDSINIEIIRVNVASDSEIALQWIRSSRKLPIFVTNQKDRILRLKTQIEVKSIPVHLFHVPTRHNPADVGTRGTTASLITYLTPSTNLPVVLGPSTELHILPPTEKSVGIFDLQHDTMKNAVKVDETFPNIESGTSINRSFSSLLFSGETFRVLPFLLVGSKKLESILIHPNVIYILGSGLQSYAVYDVVSVNNHLNLPALEFAVVVCVPPNTISCDIPRSLEIILKSKPRHCIVTSKQFLSYSTISLTSLRTQNIFRSRHVDIFPSKDDLEWFLLEENRHKFYALLRDMAYMYPLLLPEVGRPVCTSIEGRQLMVLLAPALKKRRSSGGCCFVAEADCDFKLKFDPEMVVEANLDLSESEENYGFTSRICSWDIECHSTILNDLIKWVHYCWSHERFGHALLLGQEGSGKTSIAAALAQDLAHSSCTCFCTRIECRWWDGEQLETIEKNLVSEIQKLSFWKPSLLILDDIDFFESHSEEERRQVDTEKIFQMLLCLLSSCTIPVLVTAKRMKFMHKSLIMTSGRRLFGIVMHVPSLSQQLKHLRSISFERECAIESFDVTSLHTNVSNDVAMQTVHELVTQRKVHMEKAIDNFLEWLGFLECAHLLAEWHMQETSARVASSSQEKTWSVNLAHKVAISSGYPELETVTRRYPSRRSNVVDGPEKTMFSLPYISDDDMNRAIRSCPRKAGLENDVRVVEIPPANLKGQLGHYCWSRRDVNYVSSCYAMTQKKEDPAEADQGLREEAEAAETSPSEPLKMPRGTDGKTSESQLENFLAAMVGQMRIEHEEMKTLLTALAPTQRTTVQDVSKNQYYQLSKEVQMLVSDEEVGHTFAYWLNEDAYHKYADDMLPKQPHEIDLETTVANLEMLFASKKTLIRRRYECLRINCPPMTASYVSFRDYTNMVKRVDEDARLKELDYTAVKTLQFVAGIQDPSLREVRLRMIRRLDTHTEDAPLTIENLVAKCENFTALKMDNTDMEGSHDVHVVQKKKVKCFNCG
ncbi:hypothetical protein RB195_022408 [Necator americanus]|uniref:AAA+ ATPase domain-containing protein n=1 Tax=Necator americanus TaxID=51031 RepID=A0ABR1EFH6_NECAM